MLELLYPASRFDMHNILYKYSLVILASESLFCVRDINMKTVVGLNSERIAKRIDSDPQPGQSTGCIITTAMSMAPMSIYNQRSPF